MRHTARFLIVLAALGVAADVGGRNLAQFPADVTQSPAFRYARLSRPACHRELNRRGIGWTPVATARGVKAPIRLTGPVAGVLWRTDFSESKRTEVPYEVLDCRLALALHDFGAVLRAHDIEEVRIFSFWRPPSKRWPRGKIAKRHPGALAVDIRQLRKSTGQVLDVTRHFGGKIGEETCGPSAQAPSPLTPEARELRSIVCEAADARLFNSILTPNYDRPHFNHFHMEVAAGVRWLIVR